MEYSSVIEALNTLKKGTFFRLTYHTDLPVKAVYKMCGIRVEKESKTTVRTGISYYNISSVKEKSLVAEKSERKPSYYVAEVVGKLYKNMHNNEYYLSVFPIKKGNNTKNIFRVYKNGEQTLVTESFEEISYMIRDSYSRKTLTPMYRVNISNVLKINDFM